MGENKHIKELDAFAKKYVKEIKQEQPSFDFTATLMHKIDLESKSEIFKSKALISKKGWFFIIVFLSSVLFIPFSKSDKSIVNIPKIDFTFLDKIQVPNFLEMISISNTVLYATFFFGIMIVAQVVYLKNYFDKRLH